MISTAIPGTTSTHRPGQRWHTTTFRWLSAYAAIFSISFMALLGFLEYSVGAAMEREADSAIRWQIRYFDSKSDDRIASVIGRRLERENGHTNYYGLFTPDGQELAGDIPNVPSGLKFAHQGDSLVSQFGRTLVLEQESSRPTVRVMGEIRDNGLMLVIGRNLSDVRHVREELTKALIGGGILCLVVSLATGILLSLRQMRRVSDMRRVTIRIANGDLAQRLPVGGRDELDMLSHLVNHMLDEVERLMNEVKGACDGIAHDLRTPLVRLRLQLANLAERVRTSGDETTAGLIASARTEADSILDRFGAMLRISEIGALQRRSGFDEVMLQTLVDELCDLYLPLAEEKSIRLLSSTDSVEPVHADRALLFEAFSNLLDNAIKFAPESGEVSVMLRSCESGAQLVIADNGPGIPVSERHAVLNRFYRIEKTRHVPGTGLGLGIVSAIIRLHDFELRIGGEDRGTTITINCWPHNLQ
ncbi:HAMP domain-containing sensor histidine kinase [Paraburkholderia sp.]|uniref:sensor histidine kinase n=1 Tax=Paraburkholderia sp. TaxID=1926495 RepID=UPI002F41B6E1